MYFDISPSLNPRVAVFPGDQVFQREVSLSFNKGDHLELSSVTTTLHVGAHADAPSHYSKKGQTIDRRDPRIYIGPAQVIEAKASDPSGRISVRDFDLEQVIQPRVLFKTMSFPDPNQWINDFNSFEPELLKALAKRGVKLIGIDTPSVDPWDSKALESHQILFENDLAVLEGLVLSEVPAGSYHLIAVPLKIEGADASPVRALLFSNQDWERL